MSLDEFVRSSSSGLLGKETDVTNILKGAISTGSKNFQSGNAQASSQSTDPNEMYGNYVNTKINTSLISTDADNDKSEVDTLNKIKPLVQAVGFEAVIPSTPFTVGRFIKINGNGKSTGEIDLSNPTEAIETIQSFLLANVQGETEQDKMMYLMGLAKKGVLNEDEEETPPPTQEVVNPKGVGSKY